MKNRIFAILLAAMLTAPMLFSCAGETAEETAAENNAGGDNAAVEAETDALPYVILQQKDTDHLPIETSLLLRGTHLLYSLS